MLKTILKILPSIKFRLPKNIIYCNGGLGDDLLLTYVLCCYLDHYKKKVYIFSTRKDIFQKHPAILEILSIEKYGVWNLYLNLFNKYFRTDFKIIHISYIHQPLLDFPYKKDHLHMADFMLDKIGIPERPSTLEFKPVIYAGNHFFSTSIPKQYILIHSSSLSAPFAAKVKEWNMYKNQFQDFTQKYGVETNARYGQLIQIGSSDDPLLDNCIDLRGQTNLSKLISLVSNAKLFIGLEGGIMHLARAFNIPQIIIYGGRTMPQETGYFESNIINLYSDIECSPCWNTSECGVEHKCMTMITPEIVYSNLLTLLEENDKNPSS